MVYVSHEERNRQFKVWINELPFVYTAKKKLSKTISNSMIVIKDNSYEFPLAIEIKNGCTINNNYAMIGGQFEYNKSKRFNVEIGLLTNECNQYFTDMSMYYNNVIKGIDYEFAESLLNYEYSNTVLPSGNLKINCAAYSKTGSSINCFNIAYRILLCLLLQDKENLNMDLIEDIFFNIWFYACLKPIPYMRKHLHL